MLKRILMVGGDERALRAAPLLEAECYTVETLGLRAEDEKRAEIGAADALLFPYPFSARDGKVPTLTGLTLHVEDVLAAAGKGATVLAGSGLDAFVDAANAAGAELSQLRYMQDELFIQKNAEISAEAAVYEAMRLSSKTLFDRRVLVTGYGRFGRATAKRLAALGAEVWAGARREEQRLLALSDGMHAVALDCLAQIAPRIDLVVNTIPCQVIGESALLALPPDACLLELASAPYGFNREAAKARRLYCEVLPALPARYAPDSAAKALSHACVRLLSEGNL